MELSDYRELTRRLSALTREADRTRWILSEDLPTNGQVWRAVAQIDNENSGLMATMDRRFLDDYRELPAQAQRELSAAMSDFLVATSTPAGKWGQLYVKTRQRVQAWTDLVATWLPADGSGIDSSTGFGNPETLKALQEHEDYIKAVTLKRITPPFSWNGEIGELAAWLDDSGIIDKVTAGGVIHQWKKVDRVFIVDGKRVTAKQLKRSAPKK